MSPTETDVAKNDTKNDANNDGVKREISVEIPAEEVARETEIIIQKYQKVARLPGFRAGHVPASIIKQRFKEQILHDVLHDLVPRAVDDALRERGVEAVDTPDVRDVNIEEGRPLTFTASFDTVPAFDPGDLSTISLRRALEPVIPPHVLNRPKLGFPVPIRHWLRAGELLVWAYGMVSSSGAARKRE